MGVAGRTRPLGRKLAIHRETIWPWLRLQCMVVSMGAEGARRERMQRILVGLLAASLSLLGLPLRAENRTAPKGPDEDGTKPALVRIAGEGLLNSHAFGFLTELSDDIGGRVTGTPAARHAEEWGVAKMKSLGLENVHTEQYTIWRGW